MRLQTLFMRLQSPSDCAFWSGKNVLLEVVVTYCISTEKEL